MTDLVVDASVAVKWCLPAKDEPFTEQAVGLLESYSRGQVRFLVPDLFWAEVGNSLWKAVRAARLSAVEANAALAAVVQLGIPTISCAELAEKALEISLGGNDWVVHPGSWSTVKSAQICPESTSSRDKWSPSEFVKRM